MTAISKVKKWSSIQYAQYLDIVNRFASIPASEAKCERVFASMRDIVSPHQKSYSVMHLRDAILLKLQNNF